MDPLFDYLTARRAGLLRRLLEAPATQEELRAWLEETQGSPVNPGVMSGLLKPLLAEGLIGRARPRGRLRIPHEDVVRRLLLVATELEAALASDARLKAGRQEREAHRLNRELQRGTARRRATQE